MSNKHKKENNYCLRFVFAPRNEIGSAGLGKTLFFLFVAKQSNKNDDGNGHPCATNKATNHSSCQSYRYVVLSVVLITPFIWFCSS